MRWAMLLSAPALVLVAVVSCSLLGTGRAAESEEQDEAYYARLRNQMVDRFISEGWLREERVIAAMRAVPRHLFVPPSERDRAYLDTPLPIGHGQTISAPSIVAIMTELLQPKPEQVILEVGTGSGYQAAVLAKLVKHVYTIEIVTELAEIAKKRLSELHFENVSVKAGDGYRGWPDYAPFDGVIVTCAPTNIPAPLIEQLKEGGRMVIPVGETGVQELYLLVKEEGKIVKRAVLPVLFVPMTGEAERK
ncbi:MAG: protein-L-isoaspartate(D-aspartate) O-methyltransferase [Armatimonadota bacterium]